MRLLVQDLLAVEKGIICHQTNCMGVMGGGVALAIKNRWPEVYRQYHKYCMGNSSGKWPSAKQAEKIFGTTQIVSCSDNSELAIANLFGQMYFGDKFGPATNYEAVKSGFLLLKEQILNDNKYNKWGSDIYIPFNMGCGLGGGDWKTYLNIAATVFPDINICQREEDICMTL